MSKTALYKGTATHSFDAKPDIYTWRRGSGAAASYSRKGKWATLYASVAALTADYDSITIERINGEGEYYRLTAAQSDSEVTEIHAISPGSMTQAMIYSLVMKSQFATAGLTDPDYTDTVSKIANEVQKYKSNQQTRVYTAAQIAAIPAIVAAGSGADELAAKLLDRLDLYGDQFLQVQFTYSHTIIIPERIYLAEGNPYSDIYDDTHKIFSETYLRAVEDIPDDFALPQAISTGSAAEWLKIGTASDLTSGQKRQIVKTYLFADTWDRLPYLVYAPPGP